MANTGASVERSALSTARLLGRNVIFSGVTSLADTLLLLLLVLAGRLLGSEAFGVFSLGLAASALLVFATDLGLDYLAVRQLAVDRARGSHLLSAVLAWKLAVSLTALFIYVVVTAFIIENETVRHVAYILGPAGIFRSFNSTFRAVIQGFEQFALAMRVVLLERILLLSLGCIVLLVSADPVSFAVAFVLSRAVTSLIYLIVIQRKICSFGLAVDFGFIKTFQLTALPLGVSTVIFGLYMQVDILVLGLFVTAENVGLFSSATKIFEGALVIPLVFNSVFYPRLSYAYEHERELFRNLAYRAVKYVLILAVLLALVGVYLSPEIIVLLFGQDYLEASRVLAMLMTAAAIQFMVAVLNTFLRSIGAMKSVMRVMLLGLMVKVAGDFLLVPAYGIEGAALAAFLSVIAMLLAALYRLRDVIGWAAAYASLTLRVAVSAAIAAVFHTLLPHYSAIQSLAVLAAVFLSLLLLLRVFDKQEFVLLGSLLPNRNPK
jgi:O-antigen/teichoic acid export membrane protein